MKKDERKKNEEARMEVDASSGNVFADTGLRNPEELLANAELLQRICDIIARRKLTQVRAAKLLGIGMVQMTRFAGNTAFVARPLSPAARSVPTAVSG
jgi:predicted XRE-type DNA-binding protein